MALFNGQEIVFAPIHLNKPNIVTQAQGSESNPDTYVEGVAGLVSLYNESSGLRLDDKKRLCIASATKEEINTGISVNKPIVPATIKYAMQSKSFQGDISTVPTNEANTPPSTKSVKEFVEKHRVETYRGDFSDIVDGLSSNADKHPNALAVKKLVDNHAVKTFTGDISSIVDNPSDKDKPPTTSAVYDFGNSLKNLIMPNLLNFNLAIIEKGDRFEIKPGMFGLVLPYGSQTLTSWDANGNPIVKDNDGSASGMGTTIFFSTDNDDDNNHWTAMLYLSTLTMKSNHGLYSDSIYIKNDYSGNEGTGRAYVYYISRKGG